MQGADGSRLFGTDGIRGVAGEYPLDPATVEMIGVALVRNLTGQLGRLPRIVIGRDTRESGPIIQRTLSRGARRAGAFVQSAGVITTPGVAYITRAEGFDAGVVISASHNPYQDNGIKVFSPSGRKLADEMERRIEADLAAGHSIIRSDLLSEDLTPEEDAHERDYKQHYIDYLADEVGRGLRLDGLRLGLDCANGAASAIAPDLFARLGAKVVTIAAHPDGRNINEGCGSLHLEGLKRLVVERELDLGIAFDGDADRALFVDAAGTLVDGDVTMLILAGDMKRRDSLAGNLVVATVMSNIGLELALGARGIGLIRAQVGDRYVLEELLARGAKLGGEQSGHIIFPDVSLAGDGMITSLNLLRAVRDSGRSLAALAAQMTRYPQVLVNVQVRSKPPLDSIPDVKREIEALDRELEGRGRLLVRYSGTENLARVMIEGDDLKKITEQANHLAEVIRQKIGPLSS
jgi:phosphoglucosamine mutase